MSKCLYDRVLEIQQNNIVFQTTVDSLIQENTDLKQKNTDLQTKLDSANKQITDLQLALCTVYENLIKLGSV